MIAIAISLRIGYKDVRCLGAQLKEFYSVLICGQPLLSDGFRREDFDFGLYLLAVLVLEI